MSSTQLPVTPELIEYLHTYGLRENKVLERCRFETQERPDAEMQIGAFQGQFMGFLLRLMGAERVLEIGTYTGYSALVMAQSLPPSGEVVTCDINLETSTLAQNYWEEAGMTHKIMLLLGPALDTLENLIEEGQKETFDAAFIDADKGNYPAYYDYCFELVREGGLIMLDNALLSHRVINPEGTDISAQKIQALTRRIQEDSRVDLSLLPLLDGLLLVRKKEIL